MREPTYVHENEKLNPFFSVWLSTRKTIRYTLQNKTLGYSIALAAISGVASSISSANELLKSFDVPLLILIIGILLVGPLLGLLTWGISTTIFHLVGKLFQGRGTFKEMAQAMGIVMIPGIWMSPFWILSLIFTHNNIFLINETDIFTAGAFIWLLISTLVLMFFAIWMIVIQSKAIGEVHQFSSWKGFATLIIPSILLGIIFIIIAVAFALFFFSFT